MFGRRSNYLIEKVGIDYPDRRFAKRGPGMLTALSIRGDDGRSGNCVLLDISVAGAKVKFDACPGDGDEAPPSLRLGLKIAAAIDLPVEVMWRDGPVAGLRFLSDPREAAGFLTDLLPSDGAQLDDLDGGPD